MRKREKKGERKRERKKKKKLGKKIKKSRANVNTAHIRRRERNFQ